jgi:ectoine hydroxylase-related dioxygenase (phytanoyl-CoA dioxygenase family)
MASDILGREAVAQYHDDGYYLYKQPLLPEEKFTALTGIFEEHLAAKAEKRADELDTPHFADPRLLDFLLDDHVIDVVEELIGPNIGLWSSHFISKEPRIGRATPWHTDADYWKGRFDRFSGIVTVWLAIDRSDRANGCMKVIPATHKTATSGDYLDVDSGANTFSRELQNVDESQAVYFELEPNECSLHDSRLIHGADANTSDRRRTGYTMRYFSQEMKLNLDHPGNKTHKLWHCRGKNLHDNPVVN